MGPPQIDRKFVNPNARNSWGWNFDSTVGCSHNGEADKIDQKIESKSITLNKELDPNRAKPNSMNPGFDNNFWAKAKPLMDTTGHGKLTKSLKD